MSQMLCPPPVFHELTDSLEWPLEVRELEHLLCQPLPHFIFTGPYPVVSPIATHILDDLRQRPPPNKAEENGECSSSRVSEVFDIVLSTVAALRELVRLECYGCPRPTAPLWFTLIKALGLACSPEASIIAEAPFILPRFSPLSSGDMLDGNSSILVSYIVDGNTLCGSSSPRSPIDVDLSADGTDSGEDLHADYAEDDWDDSDESSSESSIASSIDIPFDAHMLRGSGRRLCAVLPVICVADSDNIASLVTSTVYQRRIWNIDDPVVGIELSKTSTIACILLGWADTESADDDYLPAVHLARATTGSPSGPSLGAFDLTDARSALALAQFILSLDIHFGNIVSKADRKPSTNGLPWRSDHVQEQCHGSSDLGTRIAQWASAIDTHGESLETLDPSPPSMPRKKLSTIPEGESAKPGLAPAPSPASSQREEHSTKKSAGTTATGNTAVSNVKAAKEKSETSQSRASTDDVASESVQSQESKKTGSKAASSTSGKRSSSELAALAKGGLDESVTPSSFLFERRAFTITRIRLSPSTSCEDCEEINEMIAIYDNMTRFLWPKKWSTLDALPPVDAAVENVRRALFERYKSMANEPWVKDSPELEAAYVDIISSRLSVLLYASVGAYTLHAALTHRSVNEAESRHDWDHMLYRFYVSNAADIFSPNVLLERSLTYSRNKAIDFILDNQGTPITELQNKFAEMQSSLVKKYRAHCAHATDCASEMQHDDTVVTQADAALGQAAEFRRQILAKAVQPDKMVTMVKRHARAEPQSGICDAVLVGVIDEVLDGVSSPVAQRFFTEFALVLGVAPSDPLRDQSTTSPLALDSPPLLQPSEPTAKVPKTATTVKPPKTTKAVKNSKAKETRLHAFPTPMNDSERRRLLDHPLAISSSVLIPSKTSETLIQIAESDTTAIKDTHLLLPVMVVEYKKRSDNATKALNQGRFYSIAAVTFLAMLGIEKQPVFALITNGKLGGVLISWQSPESKKIYIMDRNICTFDLGDPLQALHFATFLLRLRDQQKKLEKVFEAKKEEFRQKLTNDQFEKWSKAAQAAFLETQRLAEEASASAGQSLAHDPQNPAGETPASDMGAGASDASSPAVVVV